MKQGKFWHHLQAARYEVLYVEPRPRRGVAIARRGSVSWARENRGRLTHGDTLVGSLSSNLDSVGLDNDSTMDIYFVDIELFFRFSLVFVLFLDVPRLGKLIYNVVCQLCFRTTRLKQQIRPVFLCTTELSYLCADKDLITWRN